MLWPILTSRAGLLAIAAAGVFVFYEGIPAGPLNLIPGVHHITDGRVDRERRAAREGYVQEARAIAAEAEAAEVKRQLDAGRKALSLYAEQLSDAQARERAATDEAEQRIVEHEQARAAAGKSCPLDSDDLRFLLR